MRTPVDVEIVIPAFHGSSRLPVKLAAMVTFLADRRWSSRVVVIDDGSYDDAAAMARAVATDDVEVVAIGCTEAGRRASVLRGLRTSSSRFVGFTDAGLSAPPAALEPAVAALEGGAAAAIASRHLTGSASVVPRPGGRRLGGQVFRTVARPLVPAVHDTPYGFTIVDRVRAQTAITRCRDTGVALDVELLRQIRVAGGRIAEIPVTWTDDPRPALRPVHDGFAAITAVSRMHGRIARADLPGPDVR